MTLADLVDAGPAVSRRGVRKITRSDRSSFVLHGFSARHRILDERRDELVLKYPDQWVGLASNGTLVAADTVDELVEKLERKSVPRSDVAVRFMATKRRRMIL